MHKKIKWVTRGENCTIFIRERKQKDNCPATVFSSTSQLFCSATICSLVNEAAKTGKNKKKHQTKPNSHKFLLLQLSLISVDNSVPNKTKAGSRYQQNIQNRQSKLQVNSICPLQKAAENTHTHTHSSNPFRTKVLYKTALIIIIVIIIIIIKK